MPVNQEQADAILERLADGESLRAICRSHGMPNKATVFRWLGEDAAFRDQYARAREAQADALFDDILHIADTPVIGEKRKILANQEVGPDGEEGEETHLRTLEITQGDMIEHRKLQVDARKWMAGKLKPKVYGDKLDVNHSGRLAVSPVPLTAEQWAAQHAGDD